MNPGDWLAVALACAAGAMSPGPSLAMIIRHALRSPGQGARASVAHALGVGCYATLAALGLAWVLVRQPHWSLAIQALASLWLLRLIWQLWSEPPEAADSHQLAAVAWRDGLLMGLINPKVVLFFVAIFSAVLPASASLPERLGAAGLAVIIDAGWYLVVSLSIQYGSLRDWLRRHEYALQRLSALVFLALLISLWLGVIL